MRIALNACVGAFALAVCLIAIRGFADSALPLLGGFDGDRIDSVYPPTDEPSVGELSKLIFRLRSIDPKSLEAKVPTDAESAPHRLGDAVNVEGRITQIAALKVPQRLVEFLEISRLQVIDIATGEFNTRVITTALPPAAKPGDRISGIGVVIELAGESLERDSLTSAVATARVRWFPKSPVNVGWKMLSQQGVDVSLLADVAARNRLPLMADDGDAFYSLLAAADQIGRRPGTTSPPKDVEPVSLLREPDEYVGEWMRMSLDTVQVTRVAVTESDRQKQLGSDHYFQIDAVGDLGNVVVQIARPEGEQGPPARFENRYPVSLVVRELPDFLRQRIRAQEGGEAMVSEISEPIVVDAFFFRLWSYATDYMKLYGGGDQFGPLLIAARIRSGDQDRGDPAGVGIIGWIAAGAILSAMLGIWLWNRAVSKRDERIKERRKQSESEQIEIPDEAAF